MTTQTTETEARLINERDAAIALLKELEWTELVFQPGCCPMCNNYKREGHEPDCRLAKVLNA